MGNPAKGLVKSIQLIRPLRLMFLLSIRSSWRGVDDIDLGRFLTFLACALGMWCHMSYHYFLVL